MKVSITVSSTTTIIIQANSKISLVTCQITSAKVTHTAIQAASDGFIFIPPKYSLNFSSFV